MSTRTTITWEGESIAALESVIRQAEARDDLTPEEACWYGIALMRSGRLSEAEAPLRRAANAGVLDGQVELGTWLRGVGRTNEALEWLTRIRPHLTGSLAVRCDRNIAVAMVYAGRAEEGAALFRDARERAHALQDDYQVGSVDVGLSVTYQFLGDKARAARHIRLAAQRFTFENSGYAYVTVQTSLLEIAMANGNLAEAERIVQRTRALMDPVPVRYHMAHFLTTCAHYYRLIGNTSAYEDALQSVYDYALETDELRLRAYCAPRLAALREAEGQLSAAMDILHGTPREADGEHSASFYWTRGLILLRRGSTEAALHELETAVRRSSSSHRWHERPWIQLHLAYAHFKLGRWDACATVLREALEANTERWSMEVVLPYLRSVRDMLEAAQRDPSLSLYADAALDTLRRVDTVHQNVVQLMTLGRTEAHSQNGALPLSWRAVAYLANLALRGGSRHRRDIEVDLYPEHAPKTAEQYVRAARADINKALPGLVTLTSSDKRNDLAKDWTVRTDVHDVRDAIDANDFERATTAFRGEFLPELDSEWTQETRRALLLAYRQLACRVLEEHTASERWHDVIGVCNAYLARDPLDIELLEWRVTAARHVCCASELGQYVAQLEAALL